MIPVAPEILHSSWYTNVRRSTKQLGSTERCNECIRWIAASGSTGSLCARARCVVHWRSCPRPLTGVSDAFISTGQTRSPRRKVRSYGQDPSPPHGCSANEFTTSVPPGYPPSKPTKRTEQQVSQRTKGTVPEPLAFSSVSNDEQAKRKFLTLRSSARFGA